MLRVDIGCGDTKPEHFIGVDICPGPGVDIVADISKVLPFDDSSVDELRAHDVIEHLPDRINTMNEIWRVCKPGARVDIYVPSTDGRGAFQDPTHISFWNINSFKYFCLEFPVYLRLCRKYGFQGAFQVVTLEHEESPDQVVHVKAVLEVVKPFSDEILMAALPTPVQQPVAQALSFPVIPPVETDEARPFWSVMIPAYNPKPEFLEQTLSRLLAQAESASQMQIEVVDDASTQVDVEAIVRSIGQGRIHYYRQPANLGLLDNWNFCLRRATGHWIHLLHQDDWVLPEFYVRLRAASAQPGVGAAFCRHGYIDEAGDQRLVSALERETAGVLDQWLPRIAVSQRIQFASIVVKRSTYEAIGGFSAAAGSAADWEMWKRIAVHYPVWFEPELLACYRLHSVSESSRLIQTGTNIADTRRSIDLTQTYLPPAMAVSLSNQARDHYALYALATAQRLLTEGQPTAALAQLREGLKCSQSPQVKEQLIAMLLAYEAIEPEDAALVELRQHIQHYQANGTDLAARHTLDQARQQLAEQVLNATEAQLENLYRGALGKHHQALLQSGFK